MRDTAEYPEGVDAGTLKLVGSNEETTYKTFKLLLENEAEYNKMSRACNPYGDGTPANESPISLKRDRIPRGWRGNRGVRNEIFQTVLRF